MKACLSAAAAALVLLAAATCGRSREAGNADSRGAFGAAPQSVAAPATPGECGHSACADAFFIDVAPADCAAGAACSLSVKLVATGDFHINDEYPYRFRADDSASVEFLGTDGVGRNAFSKDAGDWRRLDAKSGAMTVKLKPLNLADPLDRPRTVAGTLKLSVCSEKSCLVEQRRVSATVVVK